MAPMPSIESSDVYGPQERRRLLWVARRSIEQGLAQGTPLSIETDSEPAALGQIRASFVTLKRDGKLRGCIGSLEASRPLLQDVAENAWKAAFQDPRFMPLTNAELQGLKIEISILTPLQPLAFRDEADLVAQLRPGTDGLLIRHGRHRGTFLPAVWEQLPEVAAFWAQLKRKAGLPPDFWRDDLECWRYETIKIADEDDKGGGDARCKT